MKSMGLKILIILFVLVPMFRNVSFGQVNDLQKYYVKVNPGAMSYFGELSPASFNILTHFQKGTRFGGSIAIGKQIWPFFGLQAQFLSGNLYNEAPDNTYFTGTVNEFGVAGRFEPLKLVKLRSHRLSPFITAGISAFTFRSVHREMGTNLVLLPDFGYDIDGVTNSGVQTALSLPLGIGISYQAFPFLAIEIEHGQRLTNTDLLDCVKGVGNRNDQYSHTSIGFRISIPAKTEKLPEPVSQIPMEPVKKVAEPVKEVIPLYNIYVEVTLPEKLVAGETSEMKIRINKGKYTGAGKLVQGWPQGFTLTDVSKSTPFTFTDQNLILEWDKMPADAIVTYTCGVKVGDNVRGSKEISGTFDYKRPDSVDLVRFTKLVEVEGSEPPAAAKPQAGARGNIRPSKALTGIEFRIQIGAFRENSSAETQLAAKHKITEVIQEESIDGWYKYTVGSFRTYDEAAKYRDTFIARSGINSAFIVAYRDGKRLAKITDAFK